MKRSVLKSLEKIALNLTEKMEKILHDHSYYTCYHHVKHEDVSHIRESCVAIAMTITEISILMSKLEDDIDPDHMKQLKVLKSQLGEIE